MAKINFRIERSIPSPQAGRGNQSSQIFRKLFLAINLIRETSVKSKIQCRSDLVALATHRLWNVIGSELNDSFKESKKLARPMQVGINRVARGVTHVARFVPI